MQNHIRWHVLPLKDWCIVLIVVAWLQACKPMFQKKKIYIVGYSKQVMWSRSAWQGIWFNFPSCTKILFCQISTCKVLKVLWYVYTFCMFWISAVNFASYPGLQKYGMSVFSVHKAFNSKEVWHWWLYHRNVTWKYCGTSGSEKDHLNVLGLHVFKYL